MEKYIYESDGYFDPRFEDYEDDPDDIKPAEMKSDSEYVCDAIEHLSDAIADLQGVDDEVVMDLIHIIDKLKHEWDIEK